MDIPLSGALFITNPRRRNKRRSSVARPNTRYKNTIIMRHTGMSRAQVQRLKSKKGKTDERYKRDLAKYNRLFKEAGGEKARVAHRDSRPARIKQFKRVISAPTERKAKSMKRNPRRKKSAWQRYLKAASGKGYSLAELRAGYRTLVRRHGSNAAKIVADAKKFKPKRGAALKKRKSVKRKSASKAPARLGFSLSRVQRVVRKKNKNGVYQYFAVLGRSGTVMKRISKATYNMLRAKGIGARGKTLKKRRGTRKGMVRKTARRAYMKKRPAKRSSAARGRSRAKVTAKRAKRARPVGGYRRIRTKRGMRYMKDGKFISKAAYNRAMPAGLRRNRKNPGRRGFGALALRKNSRMRKNPGVLGGALNLFDRSANMLARVPVVGRLAPYLPTAGVFASVAAIHYYAMRYLGPKLPELAEKAGDLIGQGEYGYKVGTMAQKAGYTIGGLAVAGLLGVGTSRFPKLFPSRAASMTFATAAVGTGVFLDVMDYLRGQDTPDEFMAGEDMDPMLSPTRVVLSTVWRTRAVTSTDSQ
jgi:hypothetical protein